MNGLELARAFYEFSRPILDMHLPDLLEVAALGLVGEGSECFGLDDEISRDHDFGPCFCLWLPKDVLEQNSSRIEEALALLPETFEGFASRLAPARRMGRTGPMSIEGFYQGLLGRAQAPESLQDWLTIPEFQLACATNGEVFFDQSGVFSQIRSALMAHYPEELKLTRIAARCMQMAQSGQYNLPRALARNDQAAQLFALSRFCEAALSFVYLINKRYMPFYKHAGRLAKDLPLLGTEVHALITQLASLPVDEESVSSIEDFCGLCARYLNENGMSSTRDNWLWVHGPQVMQKVHDPLLRSRNLITFV